MDDRVSAWLESLGLTRYQSTFQQNAITWDVLPELNDDDLSSLGVLLGHRKQLLRAIERLSPGGEGQGATRRSVSADPNIQPLASDRGHGERRQLTVMFCDLAGSTALARRLDPEDLQTTIQRFLDTCGHAISRFDGYIAKYMGDGLLAYFGYPHAYEHDAERAVHAGLAVRDLVRGLMRDGHQEHEIAARIGIATGHVIVGELIGQETARERSVFGETPNLAARLQSLAAPNQLVVDSATKRLVGNEFEFADQGTVALKGFDAPVQVWQVVGSTPSASRFESYHSGRITQFVGRESEMALLLGRWREVVEGEGQVVLLSGEAGIGKSRLVRNLCERLADECYQAVRFQCSPYHTSTVLYPAINYLRQMAGLTSEDDPTAQLQKLETAIVSNGMHDPTTVSLLADLCSIPGDADHPFPAISSDKRKDLTLEALVQLLHSFEDRGSTLFLVEDAHWLDPTTTDFLTRVIARIKQMRVLLLMTFRPDFKSEWAELNHVTFLTLSRLPRRHSAELLASMTGGKTLPVEVEQTILAKTDGVPLYLEELTKNLIESELLTEEKDSYSLKAPLQELSIPNSLQALLMERLDRFGSAKEIAQIAAAIGREFNYELLQTVLDVNEGQLKNALSRFVESGFLLQEGAIPEAKYRFKHALLQDAAYSTLPKKTRRTLHARIATALERRFAERVKTEPELVAYHYEQAGLIHPAIRYWRLAAYRDAERSANVEALNHFGKALELVKALSPGSDRDDAELELLIARGAPMVTVKGYASEEIEHNYRRARELSRNDHGSDRHFFALWGLWVFHLVRGPLGTARGLAEHLLSMANDPQKPDRDARAHESAGSTYSFLGMLAEAKHHLTLAISDRHQSHVAGLPYAQDPGITARIMLARTYWILGEVDQVEPLAGEAIHMARALEHPFTLAFALAATAWIYSMLHDANRTLELTNEAIAISTKHSFEVGLAWACSTHGWALAYKGEKEGLARLVDGLAATRATGASLNNTYTLALLAEMYLRHKRIDEGLNVIAEAQELVSSQKEQFWQAELSRLKGELLLEQSDETFTDAEQCFREAVMTARSQCAHMLEVRAATSLTRLLRKLNKLDEARQVLNSACARFSKQCPNPDLMEARILLDQLGAVP